MATSLCGSSGYQNTGAISCDITRGTPVMILAGGSIFSSSDYADQTTMDAAIVSKLKKQTGDSTKLFPFPVVQGTTDKTEAAKYGSYGYGLQIKLVGEKAGYEFDVLAGSTLEKKLVKFDGQTVPLLILDDKGQIWGKKDGSGNFVGCDYLVGVSGRGFGDAQNAKATKITISIVDGADYIQNAFAYATALTTSSLTGLKDVALTYVSNSSNVYKIKMLIATALLGTDLNIHDDYGSAIAALSANFSAGTGASYGTSLAITSVAVDNTLKCLTVTFDSTAFGALSSGASIKLTPPTVAQLDAASVTGIEIASVVLTK